jgi:hypothetical protein
VTDDELIVQFDGDPFADHQDAELVPLPERFVGEDRGLARAFRVVPDKPELVFAEVAAPFLPVAVVSQIWTCGCRRYMPESAPATVYSRRSSKS